MSGAAVVAVQAMANAIKSSGVVVKVEAEDFLAILKRSESPLVVHASSKIIRTKHRYLTSYKGLAFFTVVGEPIRLSKNIELIESQKISIPDM